VDFGDYPLPSLRPLELSAEGLRVLDQRRLPGEEAWLLLRTPEEVAGAIKEMAVRGAPAIGLAAAYGIFLAVREAEEGDWLSAAERAAEMLLATRPTAANLRWAVERMYACARSLQGLSREEAAEALREKALLLHREDEEMNRRLSRLGADLLPPRARVLTHCNAGALATGGYGTALGILRAAREQGKEVEVFVGETRPWLQGARLTAWELSREGFPVTVITDAAAGILLQRRMVDLVLVGADRIAASGDVVNKVGTYPLAVLASRHGLPFYVAAPWSTVDTELLSGGEASIEERGKEELGYSLPPGVSAWNPVFDLTPAELVTAIITDRGVAFPPFATSLRFLTRAGERGRDTFLASASTGGEGRGGT